MARHPRDDQTLDLLSWQAPRPPEPTVRFSEAEVRGASLKARSCRAMALAIDECGASREEVAQRMSDYLGETVSLHMLNAYVSEARENHTINIDRYAALVHATRDWRLLALLPALFGFSVIEDRYVSLIRAAQRREAAAELLKEAEAEERRARTSR